jgi:chromosome segregation ATPase
MSRELNRDLFGETINTQLPSRPMAKRTEVPTMTATNEDVKMLGYQVDTMMKKIKEFESRMETLASKWDEFSSTAKLRFERIQGSFQRQGETIQSNFRDIHSKIATVASRTNERKMSETGMQEMMERHQQVVQSFEVRLQGLQKIISEQEYQLLNTKSEMKDVMKEIVKLKSRP